MAPPVSYTVDGVQYVSVLAGWGGAVGLSNDPAGGPMKPGYGRILTFALGATAAFSAPAFGHKNPPPAPIITTNASPQVIHRGDLLYSANCSGCHGVNAVAGPLPDLRYASTEILAGIEDIVLGGRRASAGMPSFQKVLDAEQVRAIQAYVVSRARESATATEHARKP